MLRRVQIEQHGDKGALQFRAPVRVKEKAAAGKLGAALKVDELQLFTKFNVRLGLEGELWLAAPLANLWIFLRRLANGHAGVRQIWQANENRVACLLNLFHLRVELRDAVANLLCLRFLRLSLREFFLAHECAN